MSWAADACRFRKLHDLAMPTPERLVQLVRDKVTGRHVAIRVRHKLHEAADELAWLCIAGVFST